MRQFTQEGYTFDTGPSLFTLPELIDELFESCGKNRGDYLRYRKMEVITRYFYEDGTVLNAYSDPEAFALEIEKKTGEPAQAIRNALAASREKYELTEDLFLKPLMHREKLG